MPVKREQRGAVKACKFAILPHLGTSERFMISLNTSANLNASVSLHENIRQQGVMVVDDSSMHRYSAHLSQMPAVMLLDLEMPVMDGIEVLQQLAQLPHRPAVVLASSSDEVLISAVATMAEALGVILLGAFRKPVNPADLADALSSYN